MLINNFQTTAHLNGICQGEGHSQRQSFRHSHNQYGHTDNQMSDKLIGIDVFPTLILDNEGLYTELNDQNNHGENSDGRTCK